MRSELEQCSVMECGLLCPTSWLGYWQCWPMSSPSEQGGHLVSFLLKITKLRTDFSIFSISGIF